MNNKKDCSCKGNRKDVIRRIEEANRNIKYRYVPGPKGEKGDQGERGEQGPATINIGKIETVAPDQNAEVLNSGTNIDAVLDFKIPKGPKGDKGEPGQKGDKGEPAQTIAYAMRYSNQNVPLQLSRMADTIVPLNEDGKYYNTDYTTENSVKIKEEGFYQISYYLSGTPNVSASLTINARNNDILIGGTNLRAKWEPNTLNSVSNTVIAELSKDDVINLNVRADAETTLTFNDYTTAVLTLIKIG